MRLSVEKSKHFRVLLLDALTQRMFLAPVVLRNDYYSVGPPMCDDAMLRFGVSVPV